MTGEKEQFKGVVNFKGHPNKIDSPKEQNKFRRFLAFIAPWAVKARNITEDYYSGEAARRVNEADKFAAETAEIAAKTELAKLEKVKLENELIDQVFKDDNLPTQAKMLKMANILSNNPNLKDQLEKVNEMMKVLGVVNFTQVDINLKSDSEIDIDIKPKATPLIDSNIENVHMKSLLKTKLIDIDLSIDTLNALKYSEIDTIGDLVSFNVDDLNKFSKIDKENIKELKGLISLKRLSFGMDLSRYNLHED